jgi:hypothetical protein
MDTYFPTDVQEEFHALMRRDDISIFFILGGLLSGKTTAGCLQLIRFALSDKDCILIKPSYAKGEKTITGYLKKYIPDEEYHIVKSGRIVNFINGSCIKWLSGNQKNIMENMDVSYSIFLDDFQSYWFLDDHLYLDGSFIYNQCLKSFAKDDDKYNHKLIISIAIPKNEHNTFLRLLKIYRYLYEKGFDFSSRIQIRENIALLKWTTYDNTYFPEEIIDTLVSDYINNPQLEIHADINRLYDKYKLYWMKK